jgi:hypothetical protein
MLQCSLRGYLSFVEQCGYVPSKAEGPIMALL